VTGIVTMPDGSMVHPGGRAEVAVERLRPAAIDIGLDFAIREGNRTVGAGTITSFP
jgi:elongation factor Tu